MSNSPILVYLVVVIIGTIIGQIKVKGFSIGSTAILIVAIIASFYGISVSKEIALFLRDLGLAIFIFVTVTLALPIIRQIEIKRYLSNILFAVAIVILSSVVAFLLARFFQFTVIEFAGFLSGTVTNTPGLVAVENTLKSFSKDTEEINSIYIPYIITYPLSVIVIILTIFCYHFFSGASIEDEIRKVNLLSRFRTVNNSYCWISSSSKTSKQDVAKILDMYSRKGMQFTIFAWKNGKIVTQSHSRGLTAYDSVIVKASNKIIANLHGVRLEGQECKQGMTQYKIGVTELVADNKFVIGKQVKEVISEWNEEAVIVSIIRDGADISYMPTCKIMEGDVIKIFGSENLLNRIVQSKNVVQKNQLLKGWMPIFIGIAAGFLMGEFVLFTTKNGISLKLGPIVGTLIAGFFLEYMYRKMSRKVLVMPAKAIKLIQEFGLFFFIASIGLISGSALTKVQWGINELILILCTVIVDVVSISLMLLVSKKWFRNTFIESTGIVSGAFTDPPALNFFCNRFSNELPASSYVLVYPIVMICRIVIIQCMIFFV